MGKRYSHEGAPNDSEIGKPIHMNFSNDLKTGDILFLNGARVTEVKKEEYTWTETIPYSSRDDEGDRYNALGDSRVIIGTSIRIITTLIHDGITYSAMAFHAKKGDVLDAIVRISNPPVDESVVSVRRMRTLTLTSNDSEEE